jgi:isoleucyl-tRNA synthetase
VPASEAAKFNLPSDKPLSVVIWTTTPWTIPANLAIALHPAVNYGLLDTGTERLLVAVDLAEQVAKAAKIENHTLVLKENVAWLGAELAGLQARHPFIDRASPVVVADYVTTESGTGAVHTAPGHGADDYVTGLKNGLEIYCPVGGDGKYLDDGKVPAELVGLSTLESVEDLEAKRPSTANLGVLKLLAGAGTLLAKAKYTHSYPHCWRSKTPIIFRAVDQWFVSLDKAGHRAKALEAIKQVQFIPGWGEARIRGALESRPDWCISRQRAWGVPIPAFYDTEKNAYLEANVSRAIAEKIEKLGTNFWYDATPAQILDGITLPAGWPAPTELVGGRDTLDVWIDSGSSHAAVLKRQQGGTSWPADLYLEGSDQHRGWFQSSLWTSIIAYGNAPYRALLTHGFIVDEERKKLSKSNTYQKPQTSDAYMGEYGADVIRLWIASQDFRGDTPISKEILSHVGETYRLIRNTLRYQLSNLFDFEMARDAVPVEQMDTLDRWALHQTAALIRDCTVAFENYEFHRVYQLCNHFCSVTLSATYHDVLKDRLYTLGTHSPLRRSSQTALHHIFHSLVKLLAPVLAFTTDEAWSYATSNTEYTDDSIHLQEWPVAPAVWSNATVDSDISALLKVRTYVNESIEPLRAAGRLGKSLDASVTLSAAPEDPSFHILEKHRDFLPELFIVSHVTLAPAMGVAMNASIRPCSELGFARCPRCWRWVPTLESSSVEDVCPRCAEALTV